MRSTSTIESIHRGIWRIFGTVFVLFGIFVVILILPGMFEPSQAERIESARQYREAIHDAIIKGGKRCDLLLKYQFGPLIRNVREIYATCLQGKRTVEIKLQQDHAPPLTEREKQAIGYVLGER